VDSNKQAANLTGESQRIDQKTWIALEHLIKQVSLMI